MRRNITFCLAMLVASVSLLVGCSAYSDAGMGSQGDCASLEVTTIEESLDFAGAGRMGSTIADTKKVSKKDANDKAVHVKNAEELLKAIAPDTEIILEEGTYNLTDAYNEMGDLDFSEYALSPQGYGSELIIQEVDNLTISGPESGVAEIVTEDAYAAVLSFSYCNNITVSDVTVGHEVEKGNCTGSVIKLEYCTNVTLNDNDLYGCGTYGVEGMRCTDVSVNDCIIRECSYGIISMTLCANATFNDCIMMDCEGYDLIDVYDSSVVFNDCDFTDNHTDYDFVTKYSHSAVIFKGCSFDEEETDRINEQKDGIGACYYDEDCEFTGHFLEPYITVSTAKEFLQAIRPGVTILVEPGTYDLTEIVEEIYENRGDTWENSQDYVKFEEVYDGVEILLTGVDDLTIVGLGDRRAEVEFTVDPRYAAVFKLMNCNDIAFMNLTAGHTDRGDCVGDVVAIEGGMGTIFYDVDLYGCGVNGIGARGDFSMINVYDSYIHDCSEGPFSIREGYDDVYVLNTTMSGSAHVGFYSEGEYKVYFQSCIFGVEETLSLNRLSDEEEEHISMFDCTLANLND